MKSAGNSSAQAAIAAAYRPFLLGYFAVAALYYAAISLINLGYVSGPDLWPQLTASAGATLLFLAALAVCRRPRGMMVLSVLVTLANLAVLANIHVAIHFNFAPVKVHYFVIAILVFALASVSVRQAAISIFLAVLGMIYELRVIEPQEQVGFAIVAFAAATSATAVSFFLRSAILAGVRAKDAANKAREEAERELDQEKELARALHSRTLSDSLTGLPNRRAFFDALKHQTSEEHPAHSHWIGLLDLDGFKAVNDKFGHQIGDELLKSVASRSRQFRTGAAKIFRMGGDEFGILFQSEMTQTQVEDWCESWLAELSRVYSVQGRAVQISGSIGCCALNTGETIQALLKNADFALLHAKRTGKNRWIMFDDEQSDAALERHKLENALRKARFNDEIELLFQPQVDLEQKTVAGAEVLARWRSPDLGLIGPDQFVKVAEECGLMANISVSVVRKALEALNQWERKIPLAINLSALDLNSDQTMDEIIGLFAVYETDPSHIEFEVTELTMLDNIGRARANLQRLSDLGFTIALDDFGTGYSNFNYLRSLPMDKIKIDRSFLEDLDDPMTERMLGLLVHVAKTLDVVCLVEGVEDEVGLNMIRKVGVHLVQGYYASEPVSAAELEDFAASIEAGGAMFREPTTANRLKAVG
ncbi:putative bifunctional diguanylate cyclase/phosphodiesterase [Qipengyuania sp. DGS5-3]|uniref:putative bifunctional diguanylate cyclase/phosphodiesterase n=1 Tax=Qipengyuania sp. DGS5-3 TaxID=3349632 RepID=UPI0036D2DBFE